MWASFCLSSVPPRSSVPNSASTARSSISPPSRQPRDALATMREHEVTHVSGIPTFWRMIVGLLDERSAARLPLRQITLGGEIVPGPLLERLEQLFPAARISQVYAGTEFGTA